MGLPKWLIIMFFLMTAVLFLYDGTRMLVTKRDLQTTINISATGSLVNALDPAPLRVNEAPRINEELFQDNLQDLFVKNYGTKYKRIDVKVLKLDTEPPAVVVTGESQVKSSLLGFLQGLNEGEEKDIRSHTGVVYEAKSTTK